MRRPPDKPTQGHGSGLRPSLRLFACSTPRLVGLAARIGAGHLSDRYHRRHFASLGLTTVVGTPVARRLPTESTIPEQEQA